MKKYLFPVSAVAVMMAVTATFCACSSDDEQQKSSTSYLLSLDADKSAYVDPCVVGTRVISLSSDESMINTTWDQTDAVTVFKDNWQSQIGELHPDPTKVPEGSSAQRTKLEGVISTNNLKTGDVLNLIYPRPIWDYTGQKGTIDDISKNYDYITTNVNVVYIDNKNASNPVYSTTALFGKAEQTIVRFTLLDALGNALSVPELSITTAGNQLVKKCSLNGNATESGGALVVTPASPTNVFYVAIRNDNLDADQYTLTAKTAEDGKLYTYTKSNLTLTRGNFKKVKVTMKYYDDTYTERDAYTNEAGEEVWE